MSNQEGRLLGLIGGLGPSATIYYYRGLLAAHAAQGRVARILIAHADVDHARPLAEADKLDDLARYLNGFIDATVAGRAQSAAAPALAPHIRAAQRLPPFRPPHIDMVAPLRHAIRPRRVHRLAALRTP